MNLPKPFLLRMQSLLGDAFPLFLAEYDKEPTRAMFVPFLDAGCFDFALFPIAHLQRGYTFELDKPGNHALHHAGAFYVQDPSAMATVSAVELKEGMKCLDLCASPGGKSTQIASKIGKDGFLVSNEINPSRCKTLCSNIERMGFGNTQITNADPKRMAAWYPRYFDLTVVDAPCSGEGMFRKYENAPEEWSEGAPAYCASRQREILQYAQETVADGGMLLYSTCTFSLEENEQIVVWFLKQYPDFSLMDLPKRLVDVSAPGIGMEQARRFYPHLASGEGQFVALFKRGGERRETFEAFPDARKQLSVKEEQALYAFLEENVQKGGDLTLCAYGKNLVSSAHPVPKENTFSAGMTLGTLAQGARDSRLVPHHQLFKCLADRFYRKIELTLDDPRVEQYLKGMEIDTDTPDGWAVVTVCGVPLGGAKISHGVAKNHYPKGLRKV